MRGWGRAEPGAWEAMEASVMSDDSAATVASRPPSSSACCDFTGGSLPACPAPPAPAPPRTSPDCARGHRAARAGGACGAGSEHSRAA